MGGAKDFVAREASKDFWCPTPGGVLTFHAIFLTIEITKTSVNHV